MLTRLRERSALKKNSALEKSIAKTRERRTTTRDGLAVKGKSPLLLQSKLSKKLLAAIRDIPMKELLAIRNKGDVRQSLRKNNGIVAPSTSQEKRLAAEKVHQKMQSPAQRVRIQNYLKGLQERLSSFMFDSPHLQKRLVTECSPGELELLIELLGGAKARKALKKRNRGDDLSFDDITESLLTELVTEGAANTGASVRQSSSGATLSHSEGVSTDGGEPTTEESSIVAEGATPTATLDTVIVKEEGSSGSAI
jgi:hypothetical protein